MLTLKKSLEVVVIDIVFFWYFSSQDKISSLTTVDIQNQPNAINGEDLMEKLKNLKNIQYKKSIKEAINSIDLKDNDIIIITGSLYLAGEALNLN